MPHKRPKLPDLNTVDLTEADIRRAIPDSVVTKGPQLIKSVFGVSLWGAKVIRDQGRNCASKLQHFANRCD